MRIGELWELYVLHSNTMRRRKNSTYHHRKTAEHFAPDLIWARPCIYTYIFKKNWNYVVLILEWILCHSFYYIFSLSCGQFIYVIILQFSSSFLEGVADFVDPGLPFISLSKGLELNTFRVMSQIIPQALKNPRQPYIVLSGPSFASELMNKLPTGEHPF